MMKRSLLRSVSQVDDSSTFGKTLILNKQLDENNQIMSMSHFVVN
jgi:hypothetical protein